MQIYKQTHQSLHSFSDVNLCDVLHEVGGYRAQGLIRPLWEPVNGAAVHQAGELTQSGAEHLTNWTTEEREHECKSRGEKEGVAALANIIVRRLLYKLQQTKPPKPQVTRDGHHNTVIHDSPKCSNNFSLPVCFYETLKFMHKILHHEYFPIILFYTTLPLTSSYWYS